MNLVTRLGLYIRRGALALLLLSGLAVPALAQEPGASEQQAEDLAQALREGRFALQLRYRHETVDDDAFADKAFASTLRTALSYASKPFRGLSVFLQAENVTDVGAGDAHANRGAGDRNNGILDRPAIVDPPGTSMLQAYVQLAADGTRLRFGRQEITFDDHRFVGNVGWRQHHQSYRGLRVDYDAVANLQAHYAYVDRTYRIFGDRQSTSHHLFNVQYRLEGLGSITGYAYLLRYDQPLFQRIDSDTYGGEFKGARALGDDLRVLYEIEAATQRDAGDNPERLRADYLHAMLGAAARGYSVRVGFERLGGSPREGAFQTPLATLHAFNGWADKFLVTPANGLEDLYVRADGPAGPLRWLAVYHEFRPSTGSGRYGSEFDFQLTYTASWKQTFAFRGALYDADNFSTDTSKLWLYSSYSF